MADRVMLMVVALAGIIVAFLLMRSVVDARRPGRRASRLARMLATAGYPATPVRRLLLGCIGAGLVASILGVVLTGLLIMALLCAVAGSLVPLVVVHARARQRREAAQAAWPDIVDDLIASVRAGVPLAEALRHAGRRAPDVVAGPWAAFADDVRVDGRLGFALDGLKASLADPVADRVIESLRLAHQVGGSDLGRLLRDLSDSLRDSQRLRSEIQARQSWTVNSARLAVAAPWITLVILATRRDAMAAYNSPTGALILVGAAVTSVLAYRLMIMLGRLPVDERVLA